MFLVFLTISVGGQIWMFWRSNPNLPPLIVRGAEMDLVFSPIDFGKQIAPALQRNQDFLTVCSCFASIRWCAMSSYSQFMFREPFSQYLPNTLVFCSYFVPQGSEDSRFAKDTRRSSPPWLSSRRSYMRTERSSKLQNSPWIY